MKTKRWAAVEAEKLKQDLEGQIDHALTGLLQLSEHKGLIVSLAVGRDSFLLLKLCALALREEWSDEVFILRQRLRQRTESAHPDFARAFLLDRPNELQELLERLKPHPISEQPLLQMLVRERLSARFAELGDFATATACLDPLMALDIEPSELAACLRFRLIQFRFLNARLSTQEALTLLQAEARRFPKQFFPRAAKVRKLFELYLAILSDHPPLIRDKAIAVRDSSRARNPAGGGALEVVAHQLLSHGYRSFGSRLWRLTGISSSPSQIERVFHKCPSPDLFWFQKALEKIAEIEAYSRLEAWPKLEGIILASEKNLAPLWIRRARTQQLLILLSKDGARFQDMWIKHKAELECSHSHESKAACFLLEAAFQYRAGNFPDCLEKLEACRSISRMPFLKLVLDVWLEVGKGQAPAHRQTGVIAWSNRLGRLLFAPRFESLGEGKYAMSEHFTCDLSEQAVLNRLLQSLLHAPHYRLDVNSVQMAVWRQSIALQGWKQKIRNTVSRLRVSFRFTLNPLIFQEDGILLLNSGGIHVPAPNFSLYVARRREILNLLAKQPVTTQDVAHATKIPLATVKRILKSLHEEGLVMANTESSRRWQKKTLAPCPQL